MDLTKKNKPIKKPTTQSKLDKQLEASVFFKETSKWLKDAAKELTSIHDDLKPELQNRKSKSRMRDLKSSLIPLLEELSEGISSRACTVSPIVGLNYIHQRKEQKRKRDAVNVVKQSNLIDCRKNSPLKIIESRRFLKDVSSIVPVPKSRASLPRTKKKKMSLPTLKSRILEPEDGLEYKPH